MGLGDVCSVNLLYIVVNMIHVCWYIETVSLEGTFCDTVQVPSGADDMEVN